MILQASQFTCVASNFDVCNTEETMDQSGYAATVVEQYDRGNTLLVFPSEVTAEGWRRALVTRRGGYRAIRVDRVVSWDMFKKWAIPVKEQRRPASRLSRLVFARQLIDDNGTDPFLTSLIHPDFAAGRPNVSSSLTQLLPQLAGMMDVREHLRPQIGADIAEVFRRYREFLDRFFLFEPNWELRGHVHLDRIPWRPVLFWPELLEDFRDYGDELVPHIDVVSLPGLEENPAPTAVYASSRDEITALFDRIEDDLAAGLEPWQIAVSAADLAGLRPWISEASARRDVPIRYAEGLPVLEQPGGTVFQRIDDVVRGRFGVVSLAALLQDRSIPWREAGQKARLVEFGFTAHCYDRKEWRQAFEILKEGPARDRSRYLPLQKHYLTLERDISAVMSAKTPSALQRAYRQFADHHIERPGGEGWHHGPFRKVERVYETALDQLASMIELEERGFPVTRPWNFLLSLLADQTYVFPAGGDAVAVFPYRVAAGLPSVRHYVIGLAQGTTRVRRQSPMGLRSDEVRVFFGDSLDRSAPFLHAYGGALGNTVCSCALATPGGTQVPAAELVWPAEPATPRTNHWDTERQWWSRAAASPPAVMYLRQRCGLERALETTLFPVASNFQVQPVDPEVLPLLHRPEKWSPTTVDKFNRCGFAFFIQEGLQVTSRRWGYAPTNPMVLGSVLHAIMARVVASHGLAGSAGDREEVARIVTDEFSRPESRLYLPRLGIEARNEYVTAVVLALFGDGRFTVGSSGSDSAVTDSSGTERGDEVEHNFDVTVGPLQLTGTADRIVRSEGGDTIYDYKTRLGPWHGAGKVLPHESDDPRDSSSLQLPLYALLHTQETGRQVERIAYVDLTAAEIKVIADRTGTKRTTAAWERLQQLQARLPEYLSRIDELVSSGAFQCEDEPDCSTCPVRAICRSCFVTRRFTDGS